MGGRGGTAARTEKIRRRAFLAKTRIDSDLDLGPVRPGICAADGVNSRVGGVRAWPHEESFLDGIRGGNEEAPVFADLLDEEEILHL